MPLPHKFVCMKRVDGIDNNKSAKEVYERSFQAVRRAPFFWRAGLEMRLKGIILLRLDSQRMGHISG